MVLKCVSFLTSDEETKEGLERCYKFGPSELCLDKVSSSYQNRVSDYILDELK